MTKVYLGVEDGLSYRQSMIMCFKRQCDRHGDLIFDILNINRRILQIIFITRNLKYKEKGSIS
jgi:hypothetical protein